MVAPQPTHEILEVLCAICIFVRDLALVLWSYVSQAFWAVLAHIQKTDFPALGNGILEVLRAIWTFVCDIAPVFWTHVSQAFWAVLAHIQKTDFPTLSNKILEVLHSIWTFVCDIAPVLWSYVSQAFWAVWTRFPFGMFWTGLVAAWIAWKNFVFAHPTIAVVLASIILAFVVVPHLGPFVLHRLGFRERGVVRGSYAAKYQAKRYGGKVPRDSMFAWLQSQVAKNGG